MACCIIMLESLSTETFDNTYDPKSNDNLPVALIINDNLSVILI